MSLYSLLLVVHVFSAILGLGPGFVMIYIVSEAKTMSHLKHAYQIRNRIHVFVMVGGSLLLLTGVGMGLLNPALWKQIWFTASLILYFIALGAGPVVLSPLSKPIKQILKEHDGDEIPQEYKVLSEKLFFYERITNVIFLIIIALMIIKPF
ncbi:MAG TPA: DUF2269 family protein [Pseudogracilibacillus sp.]|nr:DUF2269 family protein [Pseudogracilibacillus sp.]